MSSLFFQKYVMSIFQSLVCISAMFHIASCAFLAKSILKASTVFVIIAIRIFFPCYIFDVLCWFERKLISRGSAFLTQSSECRYVKYIYPFHNLLFSAQLKLCIC